MFDLAERMRVLGDETRLRILRVLLEESLNVSELTGVLGLAQPTVSKHLAELRKAGFVESSRNAGFHYYSVATKNGDWWGVMSESLRQRADDKGDLARLTQVLQRRREFSESADRFVVPGRSWVAWSRARRFLLPRLKVADLGCGDGAFTLEMASWAEKVYAVDRNARFLQLARERSEGASNIEFLEEDMCRTSLPDGAVDLVVISQSLHYVELPLEALRESHRLLKPGGRVLLLDLFPHEEEWVVNELKHRWMGFPAEKIEQWLEQAGFRGIEMDTGVRQTPDPFRIIIACAVKNGESNFVTDR